jgi:hypothetical protein
MPHHWIKSTVTKVGTKYTVTISNEEGQTVKMEIPETGDYTKPGKKISKTKVTKIAKAIKKLLNQETT